MSEPFRLKEKISEVEATSYEIYGLRFNPFPMSGVAPEHPRVFAAREYAYERISDFIVRTHKSKRWAGMVIIADYGNGKTHTLKLIRDRINEDIGTTSSGKCLAIFIENMGDALIEFHQVLFREIGISSFMTLLWNIVKKELQEKLHDDNYLRNLVPEQPRLFPPSDLRPFFSSLPTLKKAISSRHISRNAIAAQIRSILQESVSNLDFLKCCTLLLTETENGRVDKSWRYISGRSLTRTDYNRLGLSKGALTDEEIAQEVFTDIMNLLRADSYTNVYLLIDEIEDIIPLTKLRKRALLGGLRRIIDNNQKNLVIFIGTTSPGWDDLKRSSPPLADRFPTVVELPPLNPDQTYILIQEYLSSAKSAPKKMGVSPFSRELVNIVWKRSEGNIRKILELCFDVLEKGVVKGIVPLDKSLVREQ